MPVELRVPPVGESITEVYIGTWHKGEGDRVERDESVVELESEKATFDVPAPVSGVIARLTKQAGDSAAIGEVIGYIEESATAPQQAPAQKPAPAAAERQETLVTQDVAGPGPDEGRQVEARPAATTKPGAVGGPRVMPAADRVLAEHGLSADEIEGTGPGGRVLKEDVVRHVEQERVAARKSETAPPAAKPAPAAPPAPVPARTPKTAVGKPAVGERLEEIVPMSPIRRRIAQRLVEAQQSGALLTTFNEVDMSAVKALREKYGEAFQKKHEVKLGFMSFFVKAAVDALQAIPQINAEIRGTDIVYFKYCDIGVAIGGGKGLVVPVLRNAEAMTFAQIELAIADFANRARRNELQPEELRGGTFTITNGGVYGSLLSTPIVNPPQSGVLGMHGMQDRPIAVAGEVVIRPMMYIALTYDHRLVDGREAVTFLRRVKEVVEDPSRMLLEV